jgi:hypothetical protein
MQENQITGQAGEPSAGWKPTGSSGPLPGPFQDRILGLTKGKGAQRTPTSQSQIRRDSWTWEPRVKTLDGMNYVPTAYLKGTDRECGHQDSVRMDTSSGAQCPSLIGVRSVRKHRPGCVPTGDSFQMQPSSYQELIRLLPRLLAFLASRQKRAWGTAPSRYSWSFQG